MSFGHASGRVKTMRLSFVSSFFTLSDCISEKGTSPEESKSRMPKYDEYKLKEDSDNL